LAARHGLEP